jgi:hypothetical protein
LASNATYFRERGQLKPTIQELPGYWDALKTKIWT